MHYWLCYILHNKKTREYVGHSRLGTSIKNLSLSHASNAQWSCIDSNQKAIKSEDEDWFSPWVQLDGPEMEYGKPDDEIAKLDDICLANKQAMASPDETDRVQLDYDSQEKLDSLQTRTLQCLLSLQPW